MMTDPARRFLFLQGPHGPFFDQLSAQLRRAGADTWRVGFNAGDAAFWSDRARYLPYRGRPEGWPVACADLLRRHAITDIALYGDTRPVHAEAVRLARARGLRIHVFEEGYLRPYWVTYERGGANGHSRLMQLGVAEMRAALAGADAELIEAPARWGDMRQHVFYGALYHWFVMFRNGSYRSFRPHRELAVQREFALHLRRLTLMPAHAAARVVATRRVLLGAFPYHLALLQLEHDASFRHHGPFASMSDFLAETVAGFAEGAPPHHHLVFKAHPLEDGRRPLRQEIAALARAHGLAGRVHFLRGGKLAPLLDHARSAITVNSTAAQQALWRGLPVKAFGDAVFAKPEFVSTQPTAAFFANPMAPDSRAYRDYRTFLLKTSQMPGGYYSARGRRQLLRHLADRMLADEDPYDSLLPRVLPVHGRLRAVP